jgi:hypothetical protein
MRAMHFLREMKWTPLNIVKAIAVGIVVLLFASFIFAFVKQSFDTTSFGRDGVSFSVAPQMGRGGGGVSYDMAEDEYYGGEMATLSMRNVAGMPATMPYPGPMGGYSTGNTAEEFEVTEYSVSYETQNRDQACAQLSGLKTYTYVIFESSNDHDRGCDYRFKVEHSRVAEILSFLKKMNPKDLNENTYTIKSQVDDFTSETEVLENKRRAVDDTLAEALAAYDEITAVASANQDAESLARIIDSKIQLIERLTQQKIEINTQLDRLARAKAEQLDRLAYTYFNVSAYENKYLDKEHIADSWKESVRSTITDANAALQAATLGLIAFVLVVLQWLVYGLFLLLIAKMVWHFVQRMWTGKPVSAPVTKNGSRRKSVGSEVDSR